MKSQTKAFHSRRKNSSLKKLNLKPSFLDSKNQQKLNLIEFHELRNQIRLNPYSNKRIEIHNHRSNNWICLFNPNPHEIPANRAIVRIPPKQPTLPTDFRSRFTAARVSDELKRNSECIKNSVLGTLKTDNHIRSNSTQLELPNSYPVSPILSTSGNLRFNKKPKSVLNKLSDSNFIITGSSPSHFKNESPVPKTSTQQLNSIQTLHSFTQQTSLIRQKTISDSNLHSINTKCFNTEVIPAKSGLRYSTSNLVNYLKHRNKKHLK